MPVITLKVEFRHAEDAKQYLRQRKLFDQRFEFGKDEAHIYFPVVRRFKPPFPAEFCSRAFNSREVRRGDLGDVLVRRGIITPVEREKHFISSFDIVGDIAVLEVMPELVKKEKAVARVLLELHPSISVVAKKAGATKGEYRIRKLKVIAGERRLTTLYRENGCRFNVDLSSIFFSGRLAFERLRIAKLVRPRERVLVLFAGAGFYAVVIAKAQPKAGKIVGIELNPDGVRQMKANIALNKMEGRIEAVEGDVNKVLAARRYRRWADRIVMPLPHHAHEFLGAALAAARKGCTVHFYYIPDAEDADAVRLAREKIRAACKENGRRFRVVAARVVKSYAPHVDQVVIDFRLLN
ncbi:MAG: class I SAM-dependent methyltransferase family protein [Candidatus Micrarchaeota archaeon]